MCESGCSFLETIKGPPSLSPPQGSARDLRCALSRGPLWFPSESEAGLRRTRDRTPSRCACCSAGSAALTEQHKTGITINKASQMEVFSQQKQYKEVKQIRRIFWFQPRAKVSHFISFFILFFEHKIKLK